MTERDRNIERKRDADRGEEKRQTKTYIAVGRDREDMGRKGLFIIMEGNMSIEIPMIYVY